MKRSTMVKHISKRLSELDTTIMLFDHELVAEVILKLVEEKGMLPPLMYKQPNSVYKPRMYQWTGKKRDKK